MADAALRIIYHCLGGANWTRKENWLSTHVHCSQWQGITCSNSGIVTGIELSQNKLHGRLDDPKLIEAFVTLAPMLEQLWLSENALTGNLPPIFANESIFSLLTIFDVGSNMLRGSLHPAYSASSRARPFSFFDISGNQLTSYYRYTNNDNTIVEDGVIGAIAATSQSPLPNVHVVPSMLTKDECTSLVNLAIAYTTANATAATTTSTTTNGECDGWQRNRHKAYQTTDIDIAVCGGKLLECCNGHISRVILPLMAQLFGFAPVDLAVEDLFLAKYSASGKEQNTQSLLPPHRDDSELSFVITLNDAFQGGGTRFMIVANDITVGASSSTKNKCPATGTTAFFCGRQLHSGVEVVQGTRFILAGFVRVYPSTPHAVAKLDCILEQYILRKTQH